METKVVEGRDTRWKILERAWVMGTRGSEFRCYTECNKEQTKMLYALSFMMRGTAEV